jgi:hypothetical protein
MVSDVNLLQLGLDRIHRPKPRPSRGKIYAEAYVKAFLLNARENGETAGSGSGSSEEDLTRWISLNWEHYQLQHMIALVMHSNADASLAKTKHKQQLVAQVKALYAE